ncbi:MAG: PDZ domain-containing protein [Pyrinomonadaceae bacterium]|nr:PDZ domain-containing protein [Pyrinomonadaceae bacterium]
MYRKFFVFILLTAFSATAAIAQEAKAPKADKKKRAESLYRIAIGGSGGFLGVELKEVSSENYQELGLSEVKGVAVRRVIEDSAAKKAGLQKGDVILAFNGERITSSRKFSRLVREVAPDHTVTLSVSRNGSEMEIPVTMGKRKGMAFSTGDFVFPDMPEMPDVPGAIRVPMPPRGTAPIIVAPKGEGRSFAFFSGRYLGVGVTSLTKQLGEYFGVEGGQGLLINDVSKDSPAERAGLKAGDIIVEIDGKPVKNHFDLTGGIADKKEGDVQVTIIRDRGRQVLSVTPEKRKPGKIRFNRLKVESEDDSN